MTEQPPNKRRANRLHHEVLVAYRTCEGASASNCAINFSRVGLFINATSILPIGTPLKLVVSLPGLGNPFEVSGRVARAIDKEQGKLSGATPGMGIEFLDVDEVTQARIEEIVQTLGQSLPALNEMQINGTHLDG